MSTVTRTTKLTMHKGKDADNGQDQYILVIENHWGRFLSPYQGDMTADVSTFEAFRNLLFFGSLNGNAPDIVPADLFQYQLDAAPEVLWTGTVSVDVPAQYADDGESPSQLH